MVAVRPEPLTYDPRAGRYRRNGKLLKQSELDQLLQAETTRANKRLRRITRRYANGKITLDEWRVGIEKEIRADHLRVVAIAAGGDVRISSEHRDAHEQFIKEELGYLDNFTRQIWEGKYNRRQKALLRRAGLYSGALKLSYSMAELITKKQDGFTKGKRMLEAFVRHCEHCPKHATYGWVGIDKIVPQGWKCECRNACRCSVRYAK